MKQSRVLEPLSPAQSPGATVVDAQQRIVLFGDSHSYAIQRAIAKRIRKGRIVPLSVHRLRKEKNGKEIGDTTLESFLDIIRELDEEDVVLSMIGGNQHAVFSTIQHPQPFDFFDPNGFSPPETGSQIVPYRAVEDVFSDGLRKGDGRSLQAMRRATRAQMFHILPPPPKRDNQFIERHHESLFANEGIERRGVSAPELRLKFWLLQTRILEELCAGLGIEVLRPPPGTTDEAGFLLPDYYANDATHANHVYGELVLRQVETRYRPDQVSGRVKA